MKTCIYLPQGLVAASIMVLATPCLSQTAAELRGVVITASRQPQSVSEVVADISVLERAEIETLGAATVAQLLSRLPGLQTISAGDSARVYIRGADSRMTALYIDGVRVDSQDGLRLGGGAPWELVPASQIERIEVLRGPASAIYGADAMGGVVQIFTRRGASGWNAYANAGAGNLNTRQLSVGLGGAQGGWDYALGLGLSDSDGYNTRPDLQHSPDHEASASRSASLRLGYQLSTAHRLQWQALSSRLDSHYVPWGGGTDYAARGTLDTASLSWTAQWSQAYRTSLTLSRSRVAQRDDVPYDYQTTLQGVLFENSLRLGIGTLTAALEQKRDDFDSKPSGYFDPAFQGARTQNALAMGYGMHAGAHTLQLNLRSDRDSLFGTHATAGLAYAYALSPQWRATLASGSAFRAPTLEQSFGPYGSAALAPETSRNSEIGLAYAGPERSFKALVYRNVVSNMISSSAALSNCEAGFFCYYNVGQASLRGLTLSGQANLAAWVIKGSLDWLDPLDSVTGRTLSLRARRHATLAMERPVGPWQLGGEVQGMGERFDDAANSTVLPGYALLNLHASTALNRQWRLLLRLDNAAAAQYQQVGHYASPGRSFYAGLQWRSQP